MGVSAGPASQWGGGARGRGRWSRRGWVWGRRWARRRWGSRVQKVNSVFGLCLWLPLSSPPVAPTPTHYYSRRGTRGAPKHAFPHRTAGRHRTVQKQSVSLRTKHGRACALKECSPSLPETKGVPWMAPSAPHQPAPHAGRPEGPTGCKGQQGQIQSIQKPASQSYRTQPPARMCGVLSVGESCDWSLMPAFKQRRE